ncbi:hypothetical protein H5410_048887 [Solanum commersonii]|uniref:Uncharacterized protein n=1 Tax=Solanum commersonii TaxID=4109 RepID=A0A9J5XKV1_SOLCO|nr:hypothetical protein H5410_048887 [Solanum commersonii]
MTGGLFDNKDDYFYYINATLQYDSVASLLEPPISGIRAVKTSLAHGDDPIQLVIGVGLG